MNWTDPFVLNNKIYRKFKTQQLEAERDKKKQYIFEGQDMLTTFGKYLLQFVENQRKARALRLIKVKINGEWK